MKHFPFIAPTQLHPTDCNSPEMAKTAITLIIPNSFSGFSEKAIWMLDYFDDTCALFYYQHQIVLTDESLELTSNGKGIGPRWAGDSLDELEAWLEETYDAYDADYANHPGFESLNDPSIWDWD